MKRMIALGAGVALLLAWMTGMDAASTRPMNVDNPTVPDAFTAFLTLKHHGEPLAFRFQGAPIAFSGIPTDSHYQGIVRANLRGTPYLFVSGSVKDGDKRGVLLSVRMGSRGTDGERLRSNRLAKDEGGADTAPPETDRVAGYRKFNWKHPGGMQAVGDILAVPLEDPNFETTVQGRIAFLDMRDPAEPVEMLVSITSTEHKFGVAGFTRLADGHYMVAATWGDGDYVEFYRSNGTNFLAPGFRFDLHDTWAADELLGFGEWPTGKTSYQMLNFVRQPDGRLFLLGARNTAATTPIITGKDELGMVEVGGWQAGSAKVTLVQPFLPRHLFCKNAETGYADFLAGIGVYVSPVGELIVYATEHYNHGPGSSVRFFEFRNRDVFQSNSRAYVPVAEAGPDELTVEEGTDFRLDGTGSRAALARPWIELYDDDDFGGESLVMDFDDRHKDDFQDLREMSFNDRASSLRYWLPPGWTIRLYNNDNFKTEGGVLTLNGANGVQTIENLSDAPWSFDNGAAFNDTRITSVAMIAPTPEDAAGPRPLTHRWEIADPGTTLAKMEETGATPRFLATEGPGRATVLLTVGGAGGPTDKIYVNVVNASPTFQNVRLSQPGTPNGVVTLQLRFRDPGVEDIHTVRVVWGDGKELVQVLPRGQREFRVEHAYPGTPDAAKVFEGRIELGDDDGSKVTTPLQCRPWTAPGSSLDSDADGMPDAWEIANFGWFGSASGDDEDGDGVPASMEFRMGTDPAVADARPLELHPDGNRLRLRFVAARGSVEGLGSRKRYYTVEQSPDLRSWQPLPSASSITAQDQEESVVIRPETAAAAFYRLDVRVE